MTLDRRVLVVGREGQLARELARVQWPDGWSVACVGRPEIDLCFPERAAASIIARAPGLVVNAAAYTNVERAESEPDLAHLVNATGTAAIAGACARIGAPFVTISTDYVFNGKKPTSYLEDDTIDPIGAYGRSKAEGEALVRNALAEHLILRTSWVFSPFGANFVKTMMRLGRERPDVRVVADQRGCPTSAADLARAVVAICVAIQSGKGGFGTYHVTNDGAVSWYDFAVAIFGGLTSRDEPAPQRIIPVAAAEYTTRAARPANSALDCGRLADSFGIIMRPWRGALEECLDELVAQRRASG